MSLLNELAFFRNAAHCRFHLSKECDEDPSRRATYDFNATVYRAAMKEIGLDLSDILVARAVFSTVEWMTFQVMDALRANEGKASEDVIAMTAMQEAIQSVRAAVADMHGDKAPAECPGGDHG